MKMRELFSQQKEGVSFEFFPPKTQAGEDQLIRVIDRLGAWSPTFISMTYSAGGSNSKNTPNVIRRIKKEISLMPMPHLSCLGQDNEELEVMLRSYQKLGIENIMALRGDSSRESGKNITKGDFCHAAELVRLAASFDAFSVAVAVYPEGHPESPSLDIDMKYAKEKIDAGADFAITQMFFDNRFFYDFMERAEKAGIRIPIIPGIMPVADITKIKTLSQICGTTLPPALVEKMEKARSQDEAWKIGIDYVTRQCEDLLQNGVDYLHFYTLNRAEEVAEILHNLAPNK